VENEGGTKVDLTKERERGGLGEGEWIRNMNSNRSVRSGLGRVGNYLDVSTDSSQERGERPILFISAFCSLTTASSGFVASIVEVVIFFVIIGASRELGIVI
jgi:hypothetical protein